MTAVKNGRSIDTSMGFTPLEGLVMCTRCGDLDPAVPSFLIAHEELTLGEINTLLNYRSGLYGLSGVSPDIREIKAEADRGNELAKLSLDVFTYRVKKYFGAYAAVLDGVDAAVFTGGIGENAYWIREEVCRGLNYLGLVLDEEKNRRLQGKEGVISKDDSKVKALVIPTDEEWVIACDVKKVLSEDRNFSQN